MQIQFFLLRDPSQIHWRRKWQPTPVFLLGKSHGQRILASCSPWGHKRIRHDSATNQQQQQRSGKEVFQAEGTAYAIVKLHERAQHSNKTVVTYGCNIENCALQKPPLYKVALQASMAGLCPQPTVFPSRTSQSAYPIYPDSSFPEFAYTKI